MPRDRSTHRAAIKSSLAGSLDTILSHAHWNFIFEMTKPAEPVSGYSRVGPRPLLVDRPHVSVRRVRFLRILRATHRWIGLWGAVLGLLFGTTGFLLNHRAVLKIPAAQSEERTLQIPLPATMLATPEAMAAWLKDTLNFDRPAARVRREPPRPVAWGDRSVVQPERWQINFATPQHGAQAEYWVGNGSVSVRRTDSNLLATLTNFHKGTGAGVAWVLLVDTLAGSIILLSLTGVILWTQLSRKRLLGAAVLATALGASLILGVGAL